MGFRCDEGVRRNQGRPGAFDGPVAIRSALSNLPAWSELSLKDLGDVICADDAMEVAQAAYADKICQILNSGAFPIAMGGGHEIAFASFSGLAQHLQSSDKTVAHKIGIINLDAHLDLRVDERPSSGTPFRQIGQECARRGWEFNYICLGVSVYANTQSLFDRAKEAGCRIIIDEDMGIENRLNILTSLQTFCSGVDHLYLTIDLDGLPASIAPGVSAPAAYGIQPEVIELVIKFLAGTGKLRIADVAELNPKYDVESRTARIAARFVAQISRHVQR